MSRRPAPVDQRRRPAAGFPSQSAACAALVQKGLSPAEIGERIGRDAYHVRAILRRLQVGEKPRSFLLPGRYADRLAEAAEAREITAAELAGLLLDVIIRDDLFDALLGEPGATDG